MSARGCGTKAALAGIAVLASLVLSWPVTADTLSAPPPAWQELLEPVSEADLSGVEPRVREAIERVRERIAASLEQAVARPDLASDYGELAALYQLAAVDSAAAASWRNAAALQPEAFRWHYYAAYHALTSGHTRQALAEFERARQLDADYPPLQLRLGQLWLETNRPEQARAALQRAAETPGLAAAARYHLGQLELLEHNYARAVDHLTAALDLAPQASGTHYPLAQAYRRLERPDLAHEHLDRFEPGMPSVEDPLVTELEAVLQTSRSLFHAAMEAIEARDYSDAVEYFSQGLELAPENLAARTSHARALFLNGQTQDAERALQAVLAEDPNHVLASFLLGVTLQSGGDLEAAMDRYCRVIELDPRFKGAHFLLANELFKAGQYREAAAHYRAALDLDGDIPPARLLELVARKHAGESDRAILQALKSLLALYPGQEELEYALARLLARSEDTNLRDPARALALAVQLVQDRPSPPYLALLALTMAATGDYAEAVRLQQRTIDMLAWGVAPALRRHLESALKAYRDEQLPELPTWPVEDPLLAPPPFQARVIFLNYPAPLPY